MAVAMSPLKHWRPRPRPLAYAGRAMCLALLLACLVAVLRILARVFWKV